MPGLESVLNIHPLLVHFPIALTLTAALLVGVHLVTRGAEWLRIASVLIYLSAAAALVAAATGLMASDGLGHDTPGHELVHEHRDIMLVYTGLIIGLAILHALAQREIWGWLSHGAVKAARLGLLLAACATLIIGADRGALLVFGHGIGMRTEQGTAASPPDGAEPSPSDSTETGKADDHDDHDHEH